MLIKGDRGVGIGACAITGASPVPWVRSSLRFASAIMFMQNHLTVQRPRYLLPTTQLEVTILPHSESFFFSFLSLWSKLYFVFCQLNSAEFDIVIPEQLEYHVCVCAYVERYTYHVLTRVLKDLTSVN